MPAQKGLYYDKNGKEIKSLKKGMKLYTSAGKELGTYQGVMSLGDNYRGPVIVEGGFFGVDYKPLTGDARKLYFKRDDKGNFTKPQDITYTASGYVQVADIPSGPEPDGPTEVAEAVAKQKAAKQQAAKPKAQAAKPKPAPKREKVKMEEMKKREAAPIATKEVSKELATRSKSKPAADKPKATTKKTTSGGSGMSSLKEQKVSDTITLAEPKGEIKGKESKTKETPRQAAARKRSAKKEGKQQARKDTRAAVAKERKEMKGLRDQIAVAKAQERGDKRVTRAKSKKEKLEARLKALKS